MPADAGVEIRREGQHRRPSGGPWSIAERSGSHYLCVQTLRRSRAHHASTAAQAPAFEGDIAPPAEVDRQAVALRTTYVGSPEHKDAPSFAGQPRPRSDASICDRALVNRKARITKWLRTAIRRGVVSAHWEGGFPRFVRYKNGDVVYEGRLVNREQGQYKGFPLERDEWPADIASYYG